MVKLPLLDIQQFRTDPHTFAEALRHACHHYGFFQVRHGIKPSLVTQTCSLARDFFALPKAAKKRVDYSKSSAFRGYMSLGVENTAGKPDLREQVEIAPEAPPAALDAWPPYLRLRGQNQWPEDALPELQPCVEEYAAEVGNVARELTQALCLAMRLERDALDDLFEPDPHWQLKLASYTPSGNAPAAEAQIGVGAHTDSGWLTLLLQDESGGLQAFTRGEWTEVPPLGEGVFVCNLGEVAELLSGGYLLATPHRVLLPPTTRLSVPYFYNPRLEASVPAPLPSLDLEKLPWEREAGYDEKAHWRRPSNAMITEYGANALKSLARSHPAVFAAHHPDLRVLDDGRVVRQ